MTRPAVPVSKETLSPLQFQRVAATQRDNIRSVRPVFGRLGSGFGKLVVEYRTPILRLKHAS